MKRDFSDETFAGVTLKDRLRLLFFLLKSFTKKRYHFKNCRKKNPDKVSVLVMIYGGLGDAIINLNWLYLFEKHLQKEPLHIDVLYHNQKVFQALSSKKRIYNNIFPKEAPKYTYYAYDFKKYYDVVLHLQRCPYVEASVSGFSKAQQKTPLFYKYLLSCLQFEKTHPTVAFYRNYVYCCEIDAFSLSLGHKRIQQPNIDDILPITEEFKYIPDITLDEKETLKKMGITKPFITFNRGVDGDSMTPNHTKLWTVSGYNKLIELIKEKYPEYQLVQLGISEERCKLLKGINISLVGKTTLEELKVLLKNSFLHIDSEGGMVHLRHALTPQKSVVIFGPTDPAIYGYDNNLNVRSDVCPFPCEWIRHNWTAQCWRTFGPAFCMEALPAQVVFEKMEHLLK